MGDTTDLQKSLVTLITEQLNSSVVVSRILNFKPSLSGIVTGKFESNGRVFNFEFKGNSTSYKPAANTDSDLFSELYLVRFDALPQKATGTRAMPICSQTSYTCKGGKGVACIPLTKTCRQTETDAIGKERLNKIKNISQQLAKTFDPKNNLPDNIKESATKNQEYIGSIQKDIESKRSNLAKEKREKRGKKVAKKQSHVLSGNPRYSDQALAKAYQAIDSEGAKERFNGLKNIIAKQGLQVVFNDGKSNDLETEKKLAYQTPASKNLKGNIERHRQLAEKAEQSGDTAKAIQIKEAILKAEKSLANNVSNKDKANGYTSQAYNHVTVKTVGIDPKKPFTVSKEDLKRATDVIYDAAKNGKDEWSVSNTLRQKNVSLDAAHFITYLHELGHQIDFISRHATGTTSRATSEKYATKYSKTKPEEWFAEHFALWYMDAKKYEKYDPEGAKIISTAFNQAQSATKRLK